MRINLVNSKSNNESQIVALCWTILVLHFLTSGVFRGLIFPQWSDYIFFIPLPIFIVLFYKCIAKRVEIDNFGYTCVLISVFLFAYQLILFLGGQIDIQTTFYGWLLYGAPLLGVPAASALLLKRDFIRIISLFEVALFPNFVFAFMQTVVGDSKFFSAGFGSGLVSAYGVQRATGLFSSSAGFALYLTLTSAMLLIRNTIFLTSKFRRNFFGYLLIMQLLISGSRTAIFSVITVSVMYLIFSRERNRKDEIIMFNRNFQFLALIIFGYFTYTKINLFAITATFARFQEANKTNPPWTRLKEQLHMQFEGVGLLYGTGLGSKANARTVLGIDWVEFDAQRVLIESGVTIGIVLLLWRVYISWKFTKYMLLNEGRKGAPLIGAVIPIVLFGQFAGQGSISLGTWLGLFLLESLRKRGYGEKT